MVEDHQKKSDKTYNCKEQVDCSSRCCFVTHRNNALCCCECSRRRKASPLACIAVCILILLYALLGAIMFLAIEGTLNFQKEETAVAASKPNLSNPDMTSYEIRSKTVEKLWSITEDLNILYKENWTRLAAKELMEFQKVLMKAVRSRGGHDGQVSYYDGIGTQHKWTFATSFLYALTLITTIGYGNVTPKTSTGKMAAIAYACIGIPIVMVYLSTIGDALARGFRSLYARSCGSHKNNRAAPCFAHRLRDKSCNDNLTDFSKTARDRMTPFQAALNLDSIRHYHWKCRDQTRVPILLCIFVVALYLAIGTLVFHTTEKWSFLDGCYFAFSSLGTIGFGDLYPGLYGSTVSSQAEDIAIAVCCAYILVGVLVVAMCFNLIQEEVSRSFRNLTDACGGSVKSRAVHDSEKECGEDISMSIVS